MRPAVAFALFDRGWLPYALARTRGEEIAMSAEAPLAMTRFGVGSRTCVLTIARPKLGELACCVVEWIPDVPKRLGPAEIVEYRTGRDRALAELAQQLGITTAVLEL